MRKKVYECIDYLRYYSFLSDPYLYDFSDESIKRISNDDLISILKFDAKDIKYFTDDDAVNGGIIEVMCRKFNKLLPEDNNFDMRDYCSFIIEGTNYYVFFVDEWPDADK